MKCSQAREKLALYAGGDLPETEVSELLEHTGGCPSCAKEMESLKKARLIADNIGKADLPQTLPADFAEQISRMAANVNIGQGRASRFERRWKVAAAFGAVVVAILLVIGVAGIMRDNDIRSITRWQEEWIRAAGEHHSGVPWETMQSLVGLFGKPVKLEEWIPPGEPGVYAIMHRADSGGDPAKYTIDYCGETRKLGWYRGYPWLQQVKKKLLSQAGSTDNIYIAVIIMPESTGDERRTVEKALIRAFNPYFNREKGV